MSKIIDITKEEAATAVREHSFLVEDMDSDDFGRVLIHCFQGSFGCDWDLDSALLEVAKSTRRAYTWNLFGHDLAVETPDGVTRFAVKTPEALSNDSTVRSSESHDARK